MSLRAQAWQSPAREPMCVTASIARKISRFSTILTVFGYHRTKCDITVQSTISPPQAILFSFPQLQQSCNITVVSDDNITPALRAYNCTKCNITAPLGAPPSAHSHTAIYAVRKFAIFSSELNSTHFLPFAAIRSPASVCKTLYSNPTISKSVFATRQSSF